MLLRVFGTPHDHLDLCEKTAKTVGNDGQNGGERAGKTACQAGLPPSSRQHASPRPGGVNRIGHNRRIGNINLFYAHPSAFRSACAPKQNTAATTTNTTTTRRVGKYGTPVS